MTKNHKAPAELRVPGCAKQVMSLRRGDYFEFLEPTKPTSASLYPPRPGPLLVSIRPWGPQTKAGPVGPWMFAVKDSLGVEFCFAMSPYYEVRYLGDGKTLPTALQRA